MGKEGTTTAAITLNQSLCSPGWEVTTCGQSKAMLQMTGRRNVSHRKNDGHGHGCRLECCCHASSVQQGLDCQVGMSKSFDEKKKKLQIFVLPCQPKPRIFTIEIHFNLFLFNLILSIDRLFVFAGVCKQSSLNNKSHRAALLESRMKKISGNGHNMYIALSVIRL